MEVGSGPPAGSDLAVGGSIGATGNISTTASLLANSLVQYSGTTVTAPHNFAVEGTLTLAGQNVAAQLAASEPKFTAVSPLQKVVNFQTGQLELRVDSPFWVCGIFDGTDLTKLADTGRYPFTVTRAPGTTVGVFRVSWSTPHPRGNNYIVHVTGEFGVAMVRRRIDGPNTSTSFDCFCRDPGNMANNVNRIIHVSVYA